MLEGLRLHLESGVATTTVIDFNRFRFLGIPTRYEISKGINAHRDPSVYRWFNCFNNNNVYADRTLHGYIHDFIKYIRVCDKQRVDPESEGAVTLWERHLVEQVRLNGMNVNSARKLISSIKTILGMLDHDCKSWFSTYSIFRSEINPTKSYSDQELAKLLRLFYPMFKQLFKQIIKNPKIYVSSRRGEKNSIFIYQNHTIKLSNALNKCFCSAYFLLSYFTLSNCSSILKMQKVERNSNGKYIWFEQSVLKPRANKYVSISIGDNGTFHVPKYALRFFESLLELSHAVSSNNHLFFQLINQQIRPLESHDLSVFSKWIQTTFSLKDDNGDILKITNQKFRASGSYRYLMLTGSDVDTSILLGNTPQVLKRHYSTGNEGDNNNQLRATALTLENIVKCSDINSAKENVRKELNIEILPYEEFLGKYSTTHGQKTPIGTSCKNPYSDQAEKYKRKMNFNPKDFSVDKLACSDITNCFFCKNQVVIESVDDIWCLISFKLSVLDSKEFHASEDQYQKNFFELMKRIDLILFKVNPIVRRNAEKKLDSVGRHPMWSKDIDNNY